MQLLRNQFDIYEHMDPKIYGGQCSKAATKVRLEVDDKGYLKLISA